MLSLAEQITALRLTGHFLSLSKPGTLGLLIEKMGAMQAQDFTMAKWALGIRLSECTNPMVMEAYNRGEILRTHILRPTWHFVSPVNIRWMLSLSANKIKSSSKSRDRDLGITEELYERVNRIIRKALEKNKCLTRDALAAEIEKAKIKNNTAYMTHFMMRAEAEGIVCSGAMDGNAHTYALLEERVPPVPALSREEALVRLVRIYFSTRSPATLQDFCWWSNLSLTEAEKGLSAVKTEFFSEKIGGQTYWFANSINSGNDSGSVFLLPAFDEYIISYRDRSPVLSQETHSKAISSNGVFRPTVVANGKVIGLWKKAASGRRTVTFDFFSQPDDSVKKALDKSIGDYNAFWK